MSPAIVAAAACAKCSVALDTPISAGVMFDAFVAWRRYQHSGRLQNSPATQADLLLGSVCLARDDRPYARFGRPIYPPIGARCFTRMIAAFCAAGALQTLDVRLDRLETQRWPFAIWLSETPRGRSRIFIQHSPSCPGT